LRVRVDDLLSQERERANSHFAELMRSLELIVAKLESAFSALQVTLVAERSTNPLRSVN
jgi:hypothetical protein